MEDYTITALGMSLEEIRENYTQVQVLKHLKPKIENIKNNLYSEKLQEQHLVKSTTKTKYLENIDWSISYKKHDLKKGEIENIPYCTIKFRFQQPQEPELGIGIGRLFAMLRKEPHEAIADFHLADIEQLIDDLSNIKDNLKTMAKE